MNHSEQFPDVMPPSEKHQPDWERHAAYLVDCDAGSFKSYVDTHNISPEDIMLSLVRQDLTELIYQHNASQRRYQASEMLRSYVQEMPAKQVQSFLTEQFDFICNQEDDFLFSIRFLEVAASYFNNTLWLNTNFAQHEKLAQSDPVWQAFLKTVNNPDQEASYLLHIYSKAWYEEYSGAGEGLGSSQRNFANGPELVAPGQYGFDSEASFWLTLPHETLQHGFYVTDAADYDQVTTALTASGWQPGTLMNQDQYKAIESFFHPAIQQDVMVHPDKPDQIVLRDDLQLAEYRELNKPFFRSHISDLSGLATLASVDLKTQFQFFHYAKRINTDQANKLKQFAAVHGARGLQAFLALAEYPDLGDTLLQLSDNIPVSDVQALLKKYSQVVKTMDSVVDFAQQEFGMSFSELVHQPSQMKIFHKGNQLLKGYQGLLENEKPTTQDLEKLRQRVDTFDVELEVFFTVLRQAHHGNPDKVSLDDLASLETRFVSVGQIDKKERGIIADQYLSDRTALGMRDKYVENLAERIRGGDPVLDCFYVRREDKFLGFLCSEKYLKGDGLLLSALTITDEGKGSPFTTKFLEHVLSKQLSSKELYGYVDEDNHIARNMYKKFGFEERMGEYEADPSVTTVYRGPLGLRQED